MPRIIHLSKMTGAAGSEGHLLVLLDGLRRRGLDVQLWILVEPDTPMQAYAEQVEACGIPTRRLVIQRDFDPSLWRQLVVLFRQAQPDIVHTHLLHADLYGITAARRAGVPHVISTRHNDDKFRRRLPMRVLMRWLWGQADAGIAISEAIRQFSIQVEGARPDRIFTVHYGLDPGSVRALPGARAELCSALGLPADVLLVGSVCRLIEQKGLSCAIRAFSRVAAQVPEVFYVIAGDGLLRQSLQQEVNVLGLQDRVCFLGWRDDAHTVMAGLDILLAPSLWEGFGLVFLEAMALNLPVISTRVSAIPEVIVDGETGWLVPPQDADSIAEALLDALTHPPLMRDRGAAGRQRLEAFFTSEAMIERTLAVYRGVGV